MSEQSAAWMRLDLPRNMLQGQVAVVTGAGRGIGREAARALAWLGARVVVAELDEAGGRETERLIHEVQGEALFVETDVADAASVSALAEQVHATFGPATILINNAILCPVADVSTMDLGLWDRVMAVNMRGAFLTCRTFLPNMLSRQQGTIINMVSTDAMPGLAAYIASKQGLVGFSQSLALEVGDGGVRVIAFGPGMVDTPGIRDVAPELAPKLGMTTTEFMAVPLHTAYEGLMPVDHAGAATAYLVAALAGTYHGEVVDGYTVLEQAGLIAAADVPVGMASAATRPDLASAEEAAAGLCSRTLDLAREVRAILDATEVEFGQLPVFARPLAKRGFKNKAGQSLQDWQRALDDLIAQLEADATAGAGSERLVGGLPKLIVYYEGVPAETARFTRDQALLQQVADLSAARIATIRALGAALQTY